MLNKKEKEILQSIIDYIDENGYPQAVRENRRSFGDYVTQVSDYVIIVFGII